MEKISRILPSSPRVTSTDMRNSGVARPGMPSFGRPVGVSALAKPEVNISARASEELAGLKQMREPNQLPKDPKAAIVDRIANDFFMRKSAPVEEALETDGTSEILEKFHSQEDSDLNPMTGQAPVDADDDAPVVGGRLNIVA